MALLPRGPTGMDHDQELHQAVVDLARGGGLYDEDIFVADRLADGHRGFLVRIVEGERLGDVDAEPGHRESAVSSGA